MNDFVVSKTSNKIDWVKMSSQYLLMTLIPPRGGFGEVLFPSAKEVVLGLPLMSTAQRPADGQVEIS